MANLKYFSTLYSVCQRDKKLIETGRLSMKRIPLESIFLIVFGFLFLRQKQSVDPLIFVVFIILCIAYILIGIGAMRFSDREKAQVFLLSVTIIFLIAVSLLPEISDRASGKSWIMHDNALQIEAAAEFLIEGKNPYVENYYETPMKRWDKIVTSHGEVSDNYALIHCVKLPWHILSAVPFKLFFEKTINFYDQRMLYVFLYIFSLFLVYSLPSNYSDKRFFLVFYGLNPLFALQVVIGVGDVFVLTWVLLFIYLLKADKIMWAGFVLGVACASKHSAWFLVPFYILHLWLRYKELRTTILHSWPISIVPLALFTPFIIWDPVAFWQDIYQYPAGTLSTSYPINGFGFSMFLYSRGFIETIHSPYAAWMFQLPIGIGLFFYLYQWQKQRNTVSQMVLNSALFLFVFWFFSRFFNLNYLGYLLIIFMAAYFTYEEAV